MANPIRVQRSRKSKNVSPNGLETVYVGRPTIFGNPFKVVPVKGGYNIEILCDKYIFTDAFAQGLKDQIDKSNVDIIKSKEMATELCVLLYKHHAVPHLLDIPELNRYFLNLKGKNLSCWCPLNCMCHADVLLKLVND